MANGLASALGQGWLKIVGRGIGHMVDRCWDMDHSGWARVGRDNVMENLIMIIRI